MKEEKKYRGAIAWMAQNRVTANLLMFAFIVGGLVMTTQVKQEVFPEFDLDIITINVPYPGASPEEVEQGIVLAIEEEVRGLDGIKKVTSSSREGFGIVVVQLLLGTDANKALQDIKNGVDRITSFPRDIERPIVSLLTTRQQVVSLILHGRQSEHVLRRLAEDVREDLLKNDNVTLIELAGVRKPEISIEVPQENLRAYNLTLEGIARKIDASALELPGGRVKTEGGEVLVRTTERRDWGREYAELPIISRNDGTVVKLSDIAVIKDTFEETDEFATFNGEPAVMLNIFRVGDQTPSEVSSTVNEYVTGLKASLPPTVNATVWDDRSEVLDDRIDLLTRNAMLGLVLVLLLLGLFLNIRLAFWVTMGIPISIIGSMLFLPAVDVSINMISLFAVIVTIGIVVDDAIVVGENIYNKRQQGVPFLQAAIEGAQQMAVPVTFAILTNIAAFMPMLFVPGITGKFFKVIPQVVIVIFLISLTEALFILPAHLSHRTKRDERGIVAYLNSKRRVFGRFFQWLNDKTYKPFLKFALKWRYAAVGASIFMFLIVIGLVRSGRIEFTFMPKVENERITASAVLPFGSPVEETIKIQRRLLEIANEVIDENGGEQILRGVFSQVGSPPIQRGPVNVGSQVKGGHIANVEVYLVPIDKREITAEQFVREWNRRLGTIPGIEALSFQYNAGPGSGKPIEILLSHSNNAMLEQAASDLASTLREFDGVRDIDDGFTGGKAQIDFKMKASAQSLGLTASDLGRQVRAAFYGAEALRNQRGRDEVRVYVRLPQDERRSEYNIEELIIRAPNGSEIPLKEAAEVIRGRSYTEIKRTDGRRTLSVSADVEEGVANEGKVLSSLLENDIPPLLSKYPGLSFSLTGRQEDQRDAMSSLGIGFILALFAIFAMLAIPFKSYSQPIIIMTTIPFGIIGAVIGHVIMGYEMSIISMFGLVALAGVVVNGGLILVNEANTKRWEGESIFDSVLHAGTRRFRPIVLTSLTTFIGLAPMIFETSLQARFLIPMAISLGFGILFSTGISLVLVPCLYMVLFDIKDLLGVKSRRETLELSQEVIPVTSRLDVGEDAQA